MNQTVKVHYPDPTNCEVAFLLINGCKLPVTYRSAQRLVVGLAEMEKTNTFTSLRHSKGTIPLDSKLAAEIYAACVEIIVDVDLGEELAMDDFANQPSYAVN